MKNTFFLCYDDENQLRLLILLLHKVKKMMTEMKKKNMKMIFRFILLLFFQSKN